MKFKLHYSDKVLFDMNPVAKKFEWTSYGNDINFIYKQMVAGRHGKLEFELYNKKVSAISLVVDDLEIWNYHDGFTENWDKFQLVVAIVTDD